MRWVIAIDVDLVLGKSWSADFIRQLWGFSVARLYGSQ